MSRTGRYQVVAALLSFGGLTLILLSSLDLTGGSVVYALDDPYIHLAVAESILDGHYGVNGTETSSPSSSVLYPYLLAVLLALGAGTWGPLILGGAASVASAVILARLYWEHVVDEESQAQLIAAFAVLPALILAINGYAIAMLGMEHPLHILAALLTMAGLVRLDREGPVPAPLVAGILLGPLLRFEGAALSLAAIAALLWYRRFGTAALVVALLAAAFGAYAWSMARLGLPPLPSSVMVKSDISAAAVDGGGATIFEKLVRNLWESLINDMGRTIALMAAALIVVQSFVDERFGQRLVVTLVALAAAGAHLLFGAYGWFSRYEVYLVAILLAALIFAGGEAFRYARGGVFTRTVGVLAFLGASSTGYIFTTWHTSWGAENIYLQQYQMHRFATEFYPHPVAVNDLGYVAYENEAYVLDLWGLGSETVRQARAAAEFDADLVQSLADRHGIRFAMVYDTWLGEDIPEGWCPIATLRTPRVTAAEGLVAFYLTDRAFEPGMRAALEAFGEALPAAARLFVHECRWE